MKAMIVGLEKIDYTKKDGTEVDAVRLHLSRNDPNVVGDCVEPVYITTKALGNLGIAIPESKFEESLGKAVDIEYNSKGFLIGMEILA